MRQDIALTIHAHPTLHESVGLVFAEVFEGSITDLPNPESEEEIIFCRLPCLLDSKKAALQPLLCMANQMSNDGEDNETAKFYLFRSSTFFKSLCRR